ncbi:hypothetical protein GCM10008949_24250 [Deinococcus humi]|nr:hypothetical protein GCM10008949_24250 [Deinococcus humi]
MAAFKHRQATGDQFGRALRRTGLLREGYGLLLAERLAACLGRQAVQTAREVEVAQVETGARRSSRRVGQGR